MIKRVCLGIAAAAMTIALTAGPLRADEVERGKRIAQRLCAGCHVVGSEPSTGRTAPSFPLLANNILLTDSYIDYRLRNPSPPMHRFHLSAPVVSDITAYLRSLELKVDEAAKGKRIAERLCSNCHVVGSEPGAGRTAPPFPQLAKKVRLNEFLIGFWLRNPTPPMHSFQLPQPMVSDITTYLRSLKK
jgi:mono/diheme cytochrome c family protein